MLRHRGIRYDAPRAYEGLELVFVSTIDANGREKIAEMVKAALGWRGISGPHTDGSGRVSRATVDRVKRGEPVSEAMLRALGDVLSLPRDFLLYVGRGDIASGKASGAGDPTCCCVGPWS